MQTELLVKLPKTKRKEGSRKKDHQYCEAAKDGRLGHQRIVALTCMHCVRDPYNENTFPSKLCTLLLEVELRNHPSFCELKLSLSLIHI